MSRRRDPMERLLVFDRLEVGPVRVEPERMTAPYTVTVGGAAESTELAYRYERPVLSPGEPATENLAAMALAQVALNYGLFAREIVFHGPLDPADRRFLAAMAENTAREIYVNKLLEPNPFLSEPPALSEEAREPFLRAALRFPDAVERPQPLDSEANPARLGVLASGGKDSLLTFGLGEEMGYETHSLFVNESGRHWYTALNAHRHLSATRPERTARVWTSSDRVFAWMLRRIPFIRPDFADVRADVYPLRLWTVAVFVFGVLPEVRARGIGRLLVGDEHDTTVRTHRGSIPHYAGLFDQSRWFDDRLTRWYRAKSWHLTQLSILRQMSELLIQKTLAARYPELHARQVSCHAAHVEGERIVPCGRCEKCRRILAMHLALGADPRRCGYTDEQIEAARGSLGELDVHQERAGRQQLLWMLGERGVLEPAAAEKAGGRHRPEVLALRFHPEISPVEGLPRDLRGPLVRLLLEEAEGAVQRVGRGWERFDPLAPEHLALPARHEVPAEGVVGAGTTSEYVLGELTWTRARERLAETDTALLPVGAVEQHGPHLPLDTDAWDAEYLCREVAKRCTDPKPLVLPLISYGVSYHHDDFPGTLSVSPETLAQLVYEVGMSAVAHGIRKLVVVNGHGGNAAALQLAAQKLNRDARIFTAVDTGETSDADIARITVTRNDAHAGEIETSTALATRAHLVAMDRARRDVPRFSSRYLDFSSEHGIPWFAHTRRLSASGVLGDPTQASAEKGEAIWALMIDHLVAFVEQLKGMSLDEIHERRL